MPIEQIDMDAAARLNGAANWEIWKLCRPLDGDWQYLCAKDFAHHRHQACAPLLAEIARLSEALSAIADGEGDAQDIARQTLAREEDK
ncbi:hypothetical protein ACQKOE_07405 [Novosphingobium sp. NPDC080210]|uniref:hypothetical protein n=1 Tax=Novosphingobium sp. NPDC080210 TaxID=3390596 RepID=UPI003D0816B6